MTFFYTDGQFFGTTSVFRILAGGQLLLSVQQQHADCRYGVILLNFHVTVNSNNFIGMPSLKLFCSVRDSARFKFKLMGVMVYS
jgi:hypothetical protein